MAVRSAVRFSPLKLMIETFTKDHLSSLKIALTFTVWVVLPLFFQCFALLLFFSFFSWGVGGMGVGGEWRWQKGGGGGGGGGGGLDRPNKFSF